MKHIIIFFYCCFCFGAVEATTAKELFGSHKPFTVGIISAVAGETGKLCEHMENPVSQERAKRVYYRGKLFGIDTVLVAARIGKVASSATCAHLIAEYKVDLIIFTGVAGAVDPSLNVGDVVVANALIQHDINAEPFCPMYEIPLLKLSRLSPDPLLELLAFQAAQKCTQQDLQKIAPSALLNEYRITAPKVVKGVCLTGDQVISKESQKIELRERIADALCVEMEGASVAQVCHEYDIPFVVIRTISDYANHQELPVDIRKFVMNMSGYYAEAIIKNIYTLIHEQSSLEHQPTAMENNL